MTQTCLSETGSRLNNFTSVQTYEHTEENHSP